jgi:flagellar M-ring protein FliF
MLYHDLEPGEASQICEKLVESGIPYELKNGGTAIYAPSEHIYQLRLDMAKEGLPVGKQGGYSLFDDEKIGISPFVQNVNLKRALQEELAKSIQMIDGVLFARVHIVSAEQKLFSSDQEKTSASIILRIRPGYKLSGLNIAAITNLVAGSVEGLQSGGVTVVDSQGNLLSSESDQGIAQGAGTVQDYRERVEQSLAKKVQDMLVAVLGPGRSTIKVSAVVDMTSSDIATETYDTQKVASKEEIVSESETDVIATGDGTAPGSDRRNETIITEYLVPKTIERQVQLPGDIISLAVAAVVDLTVPDFNEADAGAGGEIPKIMEVAQVEKLIENALGLDIAGDDSLTVVEARFPKMETALFDDDTGGGLDFVAIAGQASMGIMAICALLVFKMFSGASKKAKGSTGAAVVSTAGGTELVQQKAQEVIMLRRQIASALQSNPENAKKIFSSWLEQKGD